MSIQTQKILRFIPIVNFVTVFFMLGAYARIPLIGSGWCKTLFKLFGVTILTNLPRIICFYAIGNETLDRVLFYITGYLMLFGLAWIAVDTQEKLQRRAEAQRNI